MHSTAVFSGAFLLDFFVILKFAEQKVSFSGKTQRFQDPA
jgi:hypothetical protein